MAFTVEEAAREGVETIRKALKDAGRYATGKTNASINVKIDRQEGKDVITYSGRKFTSLLDIGRKPTSPVPPRPGKAFVAAILEWAKAKGLSLNPYAVAMSIHKKGYKGTPGLIENPADKIMEEIAKAAGEEAAQTIKLELLNGIKRIREAK